jgi:TrmH family RNA methyltransferase
MLKDAGGGHLEELPDLVRAGRASALVRDLRVLSRDPAERRARGVMLGEGIHVAREALRSPGSIRLALLSPRILRTDEGRGIREGLKGGGIAVRSVEDELLASLGSVESHQGVLLLLDRPRGEANLLGREGPARVLAACGVQDPGNIGALARVAEAAFCTGLVSAGAGADPFSPRSLRAASGALLRLPVIEHRTPMNAARALRRLGLRLVGASPRARTGYREADLGGALALFVGGEGAGLPPEIVDLLDEEVRIPVRDGVESLNVAAAAAVILFEAAARG